MKEQNIWTYIGYYGAIYVIFMVILVLGYSFAQEYLRPVAAIIFPINEDNSLMKNLIVMTGMYWGIVGFYIFVNRKKDNPPPAKPPNES
jgi:hypothetical protein